MNIIRFGLDLAKTSFAVCGVDTHGKIVSRKTLKREKVLEFFANIPAAMLAMEAGSGAHHCARELIALGHDAHIIDPCLVAPYRHQGHSAKNDFNDAVAICEAAGRPQMRFIPVKSKEQQAILLVHRLRQASVAEHTRLVNRLRGFLAEFGIVVPKGANTFKGRWPIIRQRHDQDLPALAWETLDALYSKLRELHQQVLAYDRQINAFVRQDERAKRLAQVNGIGPITASDRRDDRQRSRLPQWPAVRRLARARAQSAFHRRRPAPGTDHQAGDTYLRTLLVHGARSELMFTARRCDHKSTWDESLKATKSWNKAAVALANKHARIAWALLANDQSYRPA